MSAPTENKEAKGSCLRETDEAHEFDPLGYPSQISTASVACADFRDSQSFLYRESNYSPQTAYDALEVANDGQGKWHRKPEAKPFEEFLSRGNVNVRVIFFGLLPAPDTSFGCRISATLKDVRYILRAWEISPLFVNMMLGQYTGNHLPATEICSFSGEKVDKLSFVMQQPRWGYKGRRFPISMFSNYFPESGRTDCVVTYEAGDPRIEAIQRRLADTFVGGTAASTTNVFDPFFMHNLIAHQCFMDSDSSIFHLGFDRDKLKSTTFQLHDISQDIDSLLTSADTNVSLVKTLQDTQRFMLKMWPQAIHKSQPSLSASSYLNRAFEARKRWLLGARARKETAMNLVYHLVTQKDTELNTAIARDTKDDSASMKSIAALTMIFLPASAVSSFFGMAFFNNGNNGKGITTAPQIWLFFAITLPLTLLVLAAWRWWSSIIESSHVSNAFARWREARYSDGNSKESV